MTFLQFLQLVADQTNEQITYCDEMEGLYQASTRHYYAEYENGKLTIM